MMKTATLVVTQTIALGLLPLGALAATFQLEEATIVDINRAFDSGALTSEQLVQLYLNRIAAYDQTGPKLNSVLTINPNASQEAALLDVERQTFGPRSTLHGIPVLLKDNVDTFDLPTTAGSVALAGSIPPDDAFITQQLRDAGAIILGKANMSEFAGFLSIGTPGGYSSIGGFVFNPYNPTPLPNSDGRPALSPAGSSSGSGVATAANLATFTIGTETAGSIIGPANANSVVGIKPTLGLVSRDGIVPIALSRDTAGPMTKTVTDAAIALGFLTGVDPSDPATSASEGKFYTDYTRFLDRDGLQGTRIGVPRDFYWDTLTDEQKGLMEEAIATIESLGATVVSADIPTAEETALRFNDIIPVLSYEFKRDINAYLASLGPDAPVKTLSDIITLNNANPDVAIKYGQRLLVGAESLDLEKDLSNYLEELATDIRLAKDEGLDLVIDQYDLDAFLFPSSRGSSIGAKAGYPSVTLPTGYTSDGVPLNITFLGSAFDEPTLIKFAYSYEQATLARIPPASTPPLSGEEFEYETVPEPGMVIALGVVGLSTLSLKRKKTQISA